MSILFCHQQDSYATLCDLRGTVDHVITDPPYSEYVQARLLAGKKKSGAADAYVREVTAGFDPLAGFTFVPHLVACAKRWTLIFSAVEDLGFYQAADPTHWVRSGIYCKMRAMPQMTGDRPGNRCEGIAIFHAPGRKAWNGGGTHAFWTAMPENRKFTLHPTAKPLMLCMRLVEQFTHPQELVFDPFCGTGNIGLACQALGRSYIGMDNGTNVDLNKRYVELAKERLAAFDADAALKKYALYKERKW
jgi:hypothetical protein